MFLYEILEEIAEKSGHTLSDQSIVRKVDLKHKNLHRNYLNESDTETSTLDLVAGLGEYPSPCPAGTIKEVLVNGESYPQGRLKGTNYIRYYYLLNRTIGIYPTPQEDVTQGIRIFHDILPETLTVDNMEAEPELDSDYHMLLVYGVLIDITEGAKAAEYKTRYDDLLNEFTKANDQPEYPTIQEVYGF